MGVPRTSRVLSLAPSMRVQLVSPLSFTYHWYFSAPPLALTVKVVYLPLATVASFGWVVTEGLNSTDSFASEEVAFPASLDTTQRYLVPSWALLAVRVSLAEVPLLILSQLEELGVRRYHW